MGGGTGGVVATLVDCPNAVPSGACSVENLVCAYPTQSCVCDSGAWTCIACPASQPTNFTDADTTILSEHRLSMACQYGAVTCSYPHSMSSSNPYDGSQWGCGVCPSAHPANSVSCGNTSFECRYGADACLCDATTGTWKCASPVCDPPGPNLGTCGVLGHFTCQYPDLDQTCVCGTIRNTRRCSCPHTQPAQGSACMSYSSSHGSLTDCTYGDAQCHCNGAAGWQCTTPQCPTAQPTPGAACTTQLTCSYGSALCACDGTGWSCF
jgi:hypothetical protein